MNLIEKSEFPSFDLSEEFLLIYQFYQSLVFWQNESKGVYMKIIFILISLTLVASCASVPAPTQEQVAEDRRVELIRDFYTFR